MFRKPREDASSPSNTILTPLAGRPPTPPSDTISRASSIMASHNGPSKPLTPRPNSKSNNPLSIRSNSSVKKSIVGPAKVLGMPNASILNFFKKVDNPLEGDSIFLAQGAHDGPELPRPDMLDAEIEDLYGDDRFNELGGPVKKRKTLNERSPVDIPAVKCTPPIDDKATKTKGKKRRMGPFLSDSDTDGEDELMKPKFGAGARELEKDDITKSNIDQMETKSGEPEGLENGSHMSKSLTFSGHDPIPTSITANASTLLLKEEINKDQWDEFDASESFLEEYAEGEEFAEREWMKEQDRLEAAGDEDEFNGFPDEPSTELTEEIAPSCPICEADLNGFGPDEATRHVNACLDGNLETVKPDSPAKLMPVDAQGRFARKAAVPRPGQANPFHIGGSTKLSAFSAIMSGNAEDAAWASAAAAEESSRGKPAYQRTCPFYKIMPGFFICVDAFRYGAVQGCNAYFLSHFHSDHYVGLTSSWCHGPIYCSMVTANLVKQQLQVDPKWVMSLDFERRFDIPETQGVAVTMIPANHCPGSSLFLFEKTIGRGQNPKIQRVLHCGDFRACPEHLAHPLLMPDVIDSLSGRTRQQQIDVCYLDTTYLNPRYAFPPQDDVVKACADMCASLKDENASWEVARGSSSLANFVSAAPKEEEPSKPRGRLLVVCGTYSIGKEKICLGIARALDCKIWAPPGKRRVCAALEDEELMARLTDDPRAAQIHMQSLMEIRPETLLDYLEGFQPHFSRVVGFRPTGWNYRPPNSR
jgi:DNA cross-link repair 1A protein